MNTETKTLVDVLNERMKDMTPDERLDLISRIKRGYCEHCGHPEQDGRPCQCWNDE
jgi:RNase P subunit RPR2